MNDSKAKKLLYKISDDVERNGIITNTLVADLKELRPYAVEEQRPLLAKTIRLLFEHIEENKGFEIGIPEEEPIEGHEEDLVMDDADEKESLLYLLSLIAEPENKANRLDLRAYVTAMQDY